MNTRNNKKKNYLLQGGITNYTISEKSKFRSDHTGIFSMTSAKIAEQMTNAIIELFPENYRISITDATASIGGNAISFLLNRNIINVNIVEKDKIRFEMLKSNINIQKDKIIGEVNIFNDSYLNISHRFNQDVIFIDPPWGGPDYYKLSTVILYLDNIHLGIICKRLFEKQRKLKYIVIKVPKNFFIDNFKEICGKNIDIRILDLSKKLKKINVFVLKESKDNSLI